MNKIVSPFQSASILGCCMPDSVNIFHELNHINLKRGALKLMVVKIDLAKTYDKVEWSLLEKILTLHGLPLKFIHLVMECVLSSSFSILVNRSPSNLFKPTRGLRQGDPFPLSFSHCILISVPRMLIRP